MRFVDEASEHRLRDLDRVLRPAFTDNLSLSVATVTVTPSGSARMMSRNLRPGTVMSPACATLISLAATSSTSRSVPVMLSRLLRAESITFDNTGMVWRRSTTPMTLCRGPRICSRDAVNFMRGPEF
jgi:hypothetical protein